MESAPETLILRVIVDNYSRHASYRAWVEKRDETDPDFEGAGWQDTEFEIGVTDEVVVYYITLSIGEYKELRRLRGFKTYEEADTYARQQCFMYTGHAPCYNPWDVPLPLEVPTGMTCDIGPPLNDDTNPWWGPDDDHPYLLIVSNAGAVMQSFRYGVPWHTQEDYEFSVNA